MDLKKFLPTLTALAPNIANALGGPLAGMGLSVIMQALGIAPDAPDKEAKITAALQNITPDQALALKKQDQDFAVQMKTLGIDLEKINAADRDSARNMQIQTKDWTPRLIAAAVFGSFFALLTVLTFYTVPVANHDMLQVILITLQNTVIAVVSFYFGSSASSQKKDAVIADLAS